MTTAVDRWLVTYSRATATTHRCRGVWLALANLLVALDGDLVAEGFEDLSARALVFAGSWRL